MAKMSTTRKIKKGVLGVVPQRNFTPAELLELQEMIRIANARRFEAAQIKANTALVPNGQMVADQTEAIARLLENVKNQYVSSKLQECGYPQGTRCDINMTTGEIVLNVEQK
jgi:hypothetical protein